jgi:4-aminobutyrate aminotransferase
VKRPSIIIKPPGPRATEFIATDEKFVSPSLTRVYPLVVERGESCWVWDVDGNCYLDLTAGLAVNITGYAHPAVLAAIRAQAEQLIHFSSADFYYPQYAALAERLAKLAPGTEPKKVFLCNSGAETIESAIKLARYHTKRQRVVAFLRAFHGRTTGALALTSSKPVQQRGFGPLLAGVTHISFSMEGLDYLENTLFRRNLPPEEVAAIFVEPIQAEGGCYVPPPEFWPALRRICDEHGILLVLDEIQTGMGRTGKFLACEHWNVVPDIVCIAKGLGGGLPIGAMIAKSDVMSWTTGAHTSTFGGNPVACAAAMAVLDLVETRLMQNARDVGEYLATQLCGLKKRHALVADVRGLGLLVGVELRKDDVPARAQRNATLQRLFERGLLLIGGGESLLRMTPPLILSRAEADVGLEILDETLTEIEAPG